MKRSLANCTAVVLVISLCWAVLVSGEIKDASASRSKSSGEFVDSVPATAVMGTGINYSTGFESGEGFVTGHIGNGTQPAGCGGIANPCWGKIPAGDASLTEGHIDTINPFTGVQHLRISYDPATRTNQPNFGLGVDARYPRTADLSVQPVAPSTVDLEMAIIGLFGQDYRIQPQSNSQSMFMSSALFYNSGGIYILDDMCGTTAQQFVSTGFFWDTLGGYQHYQVEMNPCTNEIHYRYGGQLIYSSCVFAGIRLEQFLVYADNFPGGSHIDVDDVQLSTGAECPLILYVNASATGSNDGMSWANAFVNLQDAFAAATPGSEIWVAEGTYMPDGGRTPTGGAHVNGSGLRTATFQLESGVELYGGFNGTETLLSQRNFVANATILSGDLLGNDGPEFTNYGDNSYHVITASGVDSTAVLDGFSVRAGNAAEVGFRAGACLYNDGGDPDIRNCVFSRCSADGAGGAVWNNLSTASFANCRFEANRAQFGGAMQNEGAGTNVLISNCTFSANRATNEHFGVSALGGALNNDAASNSVVQDTLFERNESLNQGGAVHLTNGATGGDFTNCRFFDNDALNGGAISAVQASGAVAMSLCTFSGNSALSSGGAIYNDDVDSQFTNCTFSGNQALVNAGAMAILTGSAPSISNCSFIENIALGIGGGGGALFIDDNSIPVISNNVFRNNSADSGGAVWNEASTTRFRSCTFRSNTAVAFGGAIHNQNASPTFSRCIFLDNSSTGAGGAVFHSLSGSPGYVSCTFTANMGNDGGAVYGNGSTIAVVTNCAFSGNAALDVGGAIVNTGSARTDVHGCTFANNEAVNTGGGIHDNSTQTDAIVNSIFWNNQDAGGMDESAQIHATQTTPSVSYSIVQGSWTGTGTNNLSDDPQFFDANGGDNDSGTLDDDFRLRTGSTAIDAGNNASVPSDSLDLDGDSNVAELVPFDLGEDARIVNATVDRGAFEYFPDCNNNGFADSCDISCGGTGGSCDVPGCGQSQDCDYPTWAANGIPDECDIVACTGASECDDCNLNGIPDGCDIGSGFSLDINPANGIPDECADFIPDGCQGDQSWTCPGNWPLGGGYPDNGGSTPDVAVTLPGGAEVLLNETVVIPSLIIEEGAQLNITQSGPEGDLNFSSPAHFLINGTVAVSGDRSIGQGVAPDVVIGSDGVYQTAGVVSASLNASTLALTGEACFEGDCPHGGEMTLTDSMTVTADSLLIDGRLANGDCQLHRRNGSDDAQPILSFHVPPSIRMIQNSVVVIGNNVTLSGAAGFLHESTQPITVGGDWINESVRPDCFDIATGTIRLDGASPQTFEVAAADTGEIPAPLVAGISYPPFFIDRLEVAANSQVTFFDGFDNDLQGQSYCGEAQYVGTLVLEASSIVTVQNCRLYYDTLIQDPSAQLILNGCGEARDSQNPETPLADPTGLNKSRALSFVPPAGAIAGASGNSAMRVTLVSLHHVNPPYTGGPSIPFTSFEGEIRWVGAPTQYLESSTGAPFMASQLACAPAYRDWSTVGLLHIFGSAITPSSTYRVQVLAKSCDGLEDRCTAVSEPLIVSTTRWGDVKTPYNPPDPSVQPDISDVSALVDKFRNAPGAPIKARAILAGAPGNSFGQITHEVLNVDFGFSHISACVDAFRGVPYPYAMAGCP